MLSVEHGVGEADPLVPAGGVRERRIRPLKIVLNRASEGSDGSEVLECSLRTGVPAAPASRPGDS